MSNCNRKPLRLGIVGGGTVGHATARSFMEHADVRVYDVLPECRTHSLPEALEGDLVFVCLPTPQSENALAPDQSAIEQFFAEHKGYQKNFVLKSTVAIGTTRMLREKYDLPNLVHSPEFLTSRCAITDAHVPSRNIIGSSIDDATTLACRMMLYELYEHRFPGVPIYCMTSDESEATKLMQNAFFAVKVAFFNEMWTLANALGLNWERIMAGILSDGRIAHAHTKVPGHHGFGFAGSCLPKDLANMVDLLSQHQLANNVTLGALTRNKIDRERHLQ